MNDSSPAPFAKATGQVGMFICVTSLLTVLIVQEKVQYVGSALVTCLRAMAKGSAGKETSTTTSTQKRINTMATRKTLTKRQEKMIVDSYNDIDQVAVETSIGVIRLISLQEMPMMQMRQFMMTPGDKKMVVLMDILQLCLINHEDWDKISVMPIKEVNRLIKAWMDMSDGKSAIFDEEDEDDE
jgi:predicted SnoaL-like aldol condensation-catalyzing enzyme